MNFAARLKKPPGPPYSNGPENARFGLYDTITSTTLLKHARFLTTVIRGLREAMAETPRCCHRDTLANLLQEVQLAQARATGLASRIPTAE